jgi:23S rRNA U2552 (ribose-2'-O)-methylase RlmE/FtsJ
MLSKILRYSPVFILTAQSVRIVVDLCPAPGKWIKMLGILDRQSLLQNSGVYL